jgi:hypothetical protein
MHRTFIVNVQTSLHLPQKYIQKSQKPTENYQNSTKNNKNLARKQRDGIFIIEQHVFNSCYGVGAKQAKVQSLH